MGELLEWKFGTSLHLWKTLKSKLNGVSFYILISLNLNLPQVLYSGVESHDVVSIPVVVSVLAIFWHSAFL